MTKLWKKWLTISRKLIIIPANIILTLLYIIFVVPLALIIKLVFKNVLLGHGHQKINNSYWVKRKKVTYTLEWAREQ